MILRKIFFVAVCAAGMISSFTACKDTAKIEAEKEAAQKEVVMEEAKVKENLKLEARKKELRVNSIAAVASANEELSTW